MIISIPRMEGKEGKRLWKPSSEMADWLFSLSNLVLIVSLAVTVVATIGTVWMANVREGYLNRELAEADERIAEASARGEEARSAAAAAEMRAAEANQKAEAERLERLRLEQQVAPRTLSATQLSAVVAGLLPLAGKRISVVSYASDAEGDLLRGQIVGCLLQSGLDVPDKPSKIMVLGAVFTGIQVDGRDGAVVATLRDVLVRAGGLMVADPSANVAGWGPMPAYPEGELIADAAIFIGAKPLRIPQ